MLRVDKLRPYIEYTLVRVNDGALCPLFTGLAGLPTDDFIVAGILKKCLEEGRQIGIQVTHDDEFSDDDYFMIVGPDVERLSDKREYFLGKTEDVAASFLAIGIIKTLAEQRVPTQIIHATQVKGTVSSDETHETVLVS